MQNRVLGQLGFHAKPASPDGQEESATDHLAARGKDDPSLFPT